MSEEVIFTYKVDNKYAPQAEASILYNDKDLDIDWSIGESQIVVSEKDKIATAFKNAEVF